MGHTYSGFFMFRMNGMARCQGWQGAAMFSVRLGMARCQGWQRAAMFRMMVEQDAKERHVIQKQEKPILDKLDLA